MKAVAPGKIILSGEHAVVYGKPALVMAVNRFAEATFIPQPNKQLAIDLIDFNTGTSFTINALRELKQRLLKNYRLFLDGELGIRQVLRKPFELFEFLFITLLDGLQLQVDKGVRIQLTSNIPIGCGMGSSAATIMSVLRGIGEFYDHKLNQQECFRYGLEAEKLQHGFSSGVDPYISLHGGFVRFQNNRAEPLVVPELPMWLVNTGVPESSTGECVALVREKFGSDRIWEDFEAITWAVEGAALRKEYVELRRLVRENHRLLQVIGVVPDKVAEFIAMIEKEGGAAKIAGAGAVLGSKGGIVAVFSETPPEAICREFGYQMIPVKGEKHGARIL